MSILELGPQVGRIDIPPRTGEQLNRAGTPGDSYAEVFRAPAAPPSPEAPGKTTWEQAQPKFPEIELLVTNTPPQPGDQGDTDTTKERIQDIRYALASTRDIAPVATTPVLPAPYEKPGKSEARKARKEAKKSSGEKDRQKLLDRLTRI